MSCEVFSMAVPPNYDLASQPNSIPVSNLAIGGTAANAFPGFFSPTGTVHSSGGFNLLSPNPDNDLLVCQTKAIFRDGQCSTYFGRGAILLRLNGPVGNQSLFYFQYNSAVTGGDIRVGIKTGWDSTQDYENTGTNYEYYVNTNVAASAEGIAAGFTNSYSAGNLFTFGVNGFTVYLQWNGIDLIRYTEWRLMTPGTCGVWAHDGYGIRDLTMRYFNPLALFSNPLTQTYDIRDFGARSVAAVTGSMGAGSNQLTLTSNPGFVVGDPIIVEIGGESGAGARGTEGVGGQWPALSYANLTAMNADTSQPDATFAFLQTNQFVYSSTSGVWSQDINYTQGYYTDLIVPLSLVATVTAISGNVLTLSQTATVATTAANVWLDCLPSFFLIDQPGNGTASFLPVTVPVTMTIPAGNWRLSNIAQVSTTPGSPSLPTSGFTVTGQGATTVLINPKGCPSGAIHLTGVGNNTVVKNLNYTGNLADNGFMFAFGSGGVGQPLPQNAFGGFPASFDMFPGASTTGCAITNVNCTNSMGRAVGITGGTGALIDSCSTTMQHGQQQYMGWQIQIADSTSSTISNCTGTGAFLLKAFELFACNGSTMSNCSGTNVLFSSNSNTGCTYDTPVTTINASSFFNVGSGGIDEPVLSINNSAFGSGGNITVLNPRIIQTGYIDASDNSLKAIQVLQTSVTPVTITGSYPGSGGCSTTLGGLLQAPDYNAISAEYGSMGIYSDSASTVVSGIRVKGVAIGTPGHSGHFGNISVLGASSSVSNCVVDVIQTGPTLSGNQTNAAYGGC